LYGSPKTRSLTGVPCAPKIHQSLNKADLARDVGVSPSTANQWLSMLEASGQVRLLEPWFSNRTKSIVKSPKLYLADTGLLCALLNIRSEETLRDSPAAGAIWETFVFAQLRHRERRAGRTGSIFFWRDRTRELDFVVDVGGRVELIEAKWTELPTQQDARNLDFVRDAMGKSRVADGIVVCRAPHSFPLGPGLRVLPITEVI
jgi:hypothetical protein